MNRNEEKQLQGRTIEEWSQLVERYFEATLSDDEERELRLFLASDASSSPVFDEVKAVTGYIETAKARRQKANNRKRSSIIGQIARYSAAAAIIGATIAGIRYNSTPSDICIAYIDGKRHTDRTTVLAQMHKAMAHVSHNTNQYSVQQQLSDIFGTLNDNNQDIEIIK